MALIALVGDELIGVCRYERVDAHQAEVAFSVLDAHHGRGLGSVFLEHLAAAARERHITRFIADVLPQNEAMVNVFREAGYAVAHRFQDGLIELVCELDPTERSLAVMESREHRSESASLHRLLNSATVAVVGASRNPGTISSRVLANLRTSGFAGEVYVVTPHAGEVQGLRSYAQVADVPGQVDIAVVLVSPEAVLEVVHDCAHARVHGLVVMSGAIDEKNDEDDDDGLRRQRELVHLARMHGMRIIGPSSMGVLNTAADVRLNVSLVEDLPEPGGLGLFSQSGALGVATLASAARRRLGVSSFVSAGNRADVSTNDCLQYWEDDPRTAVLGLYLKSVGNPRKFSRIARRVSRRKPVVAVKSGGSGYAVPPGHGVRHSRAPRAAMNSLLHQAGVVRVDTMHQLFDVAQLLLHQPLPAGARIGIVANSRAMAVLVADAATGWGLEADAEPVITQPEPHPDEFREAITRGFADTSTDAIVVFRPPLGVVHDDIPQALQQISATTAKTTAACVLGFHGMVSSEHGRAFPAYPTPEDAVAALAAVTRHARWRREPAGARVDPAGIDRARARELVQTLLTATTSAAGVHPGADDVAALLACYGVPSPSTTTSDAPSPTASPAVNYAVRTMEDELFGPVLSLALTGDEGGIASTHEPVHRIPPLTDTDVTDLLHEVDRPVRSTSPASAETALGDVVARISCLADDLPELAELSLTLSVDTDGCTVTAAAVHLARQANRTDTGRRSLTS